MTVCLHTASPGRATRATGVSIPGGSTVAASLGIHASLHTHPVAVALAASILVCMSVALANGATSQRFGAWELTCGGLADQSADLATGKGQTARQAARPYCRLSQRQSAPGSDATLFAITVVPAATAEAGKKPGGSRAKGDDKRLVGIISTPAGGYLAPGMILQVDREPPFRLLYETCNASGCHAGFALEGRVLAALLRGKQASVRIWTARNAPVEVKVLLDGFAAAREALLRRIAPPAPSKAPAPAPAPARTPASAGGDAP